MRIKNIISPSTITFTIILVVLLTMNLIGGIRPVVSYFHLIEKTEYYFLIPISVLLPIGLFMFDRVRYKKLVNEKVQLFKTTVSTVQDIIQNSNSQMQMLILEMEEEKIDEKLVDRANDIFNKSNLLLNKLYNLDPTTAKIRTISDVVQYFEINGNKNEENNLDKS